MAGRYRKTTVTSHRPYEDLSDLSDLFATCSSTKNGTSSRPSRHREVDLIWPEEEEEKLEKMKANKAKKDSAKSGDFTVVPGAKEDYDLDKVLADLGEEPVKAKGAKANGGSGSQKPKANACQKNSLKKGRRGAGPTPEATK